MHDARPVTAPEMDGWARQLGVGFHFEVATGLGEYFASTFDLDRTFGSFDGDRVVGTLRSFPTALTVPGERAVRASALTSVTVAPTHRRQGRLTEMIGLDLRASQERGEVVSVLVASEYPIYGRFGYGPAVEMARYTVDSRTARFRSPVTGAVELTDLSTLRAQGPPIFERVRVEQAGSIERSPHWWDRTLHQVEVPGSEPAKGQVALYRAEDGALEGYVIYEVASDADGMRPRGTLTLRELLAATPAAYAALWSFCCGVDLVTSIDARMRPTDEVLPYLLADGRDVKLTSRDDFVWVRVLDVPAALEGRAFATPGRLVLEVVDGAGLASGRFAVDASGEGTQCRPTMAPADLTLPVGALGSLYLGGVSARTLQLAGLVDEHLAGAVARADCMFRTSRAPWCTTWF